MCFISTVHATHCQHVVNVFSETRRRAHARSIASRSTLLVLASHRNVAYYLGGAVSSRLPSLVIVPASSTQSLRVRNSICLFLKNPLRPFNSTRVELRRLRPHALRRRGALGVGEVRVLSPLPFRFAHQGVVPARVLPDEPFRVDAVSVRTRIGVEKLRSNALVRRLRYIGAPRSALDARSPNPSQTEAEVPTPRCRKRAERAALAKTAHGPQSPVSRSDTGDRRYLLRLVCNTYAVLASATFAPLLSPPRCRTRIGVLVVARWRALARFIIHARSRVARTCARYQRCLRLVALRTRRQPQHIPRPLQRRLRCGRTA